MDGAKLLECVPNFSEGRDLQVIQAIVDAIAAVEGIRIWHKDIGFSAHRTVITFTGAPQQVVEAAFQGIKTAAALIDMRLHKGIHPRIGATDVCPFVPLSGMYMQEAITCAHELAKRVGEELGIPVYCYGEAALYPHKRNLADCRKGEYEGIIDKLQQPNWLPDFGPNMFNEISGISVIGARPFLIAYNINLATKDLAIAKDIAYKVRAIGCLEKGIGQGLPEVKAIGWYIPEFDCCQVSMNLTNFNVTGLYEVFERVREIAATHGIALKGSELIGCIPKKALYDAGNSLNPLLKEDDVINLIINYLGLNSIAPFSLDRIIP